MKKVKQIISTILMITFLFSLIPQPVVIANTTVEQGESNNTSIEESNSFANLLNQEIQNETTNNDTDSYPTGYSIVGLTIEDSVAIVQYDTQETAELVVALYTEDGMQLLMSGKATVQATETEAVIPLDGELPEYFMTTAYLLDTYDYSPLCEAYNTPLYTREMQELLASTVEDYDPSRTMNLDNDNTTNFAVYAESTKVIEYHEGTNIVLSVDDDSATYVIGAADSNITSLQKGDIFAYQYGENQLLIVKVASISVSDTTATIVGDHLEMEEAFSHVKIESNGTTEDLVVDPNSGDPGIEYVGLTESGSSTLPTKSGLEGGVDTQIGHQFKIAPASLNNSDFTLQGTLGLKFKISFSYYVTWQQQYLKFDVNTSLELSAEVSGKLDIVKLSLPSFGFSPAPGIFIGFEPFFNPQFSGKAQFSCKASFKVGAVYENGKGFRNSSTTPKMETDVDFEGSIFIGFDLNPTISICSGAVAKASMGGMVGLEITGKLTGKGLETSSSPQVAKHHECNLCLDGTLSAKAELTAKVSFLNWEKLTFSANIFKLDVEIGKFYYSFDNGLFDFGECPNVTHRLTIEVRDASNKIVENSAISLFDGTYLGTTNSNGICTAYLPRGTYTICADMGNGKFTKSLFVSVAQKVIITAQKGNSPSSGEDNNGSTTDDIDFGGIWGTVETETITNYGTVVASGSCGVSGSTVAWRFYSSGTLEIYGSGAMKSYSPTSYPWKGYNITKVIIHNGVTSISDYAFLNCDSLRDVTIPDSVTSIGSSVFSNCDNLSSVTIGNGVTSIGSWAFTDCFNLSKVYIEDINAWCKIDFDSRANPMHNKANLYLRGLPVTDLVIPAGTTKVNQYVFAGCSSLTNVTIPDSVTSIDSGAFSGCSSLTNVTIPDSVTSIDSGAFSGCSSLTSVTIGNGVTSIDSEAFACCISLTSVTIGHGVTSIGVDAFWNCDSLTNITIPDSVTSIDSSAFEDCSSLTSVTIGHGVTSIGNSAFSYCDNLLSVAFEGNAPTIRSNAFGGTTATVYYPADNATWTTNVQQGYGGNLVWVAYTPEEGVLTYTAENTSARNIEIESMQEQLAQTATHPRTARGIWGGEYGTEVTDTYTLKTALFSNLVPGEQYVLLALASLDEKDKLIPSNLLYIAQDIAKEDGTLTFAYIQRIDTELSYIVACGASHNNLQNAEIIFPEMGSTREPQAVNPTVTFDGKLLTEGVDYILTGMVEYTAAGTYTCNIRGIYNYSGTVTCSYNVNDFCASVIAVTGDIKNFASIAEAIKTCQAGECVVLLKDCAEDLYLSRNIILNLNGYDITGRLTVDGTLTVYDSATDDYTVADGVYGQITGTVTGTLVAKDGYIAAGGGFHKFGGQYISTVSLRPKNAGIYYTATFLADEILLCELETGVAVSLTDMPGTDFESDEDTLYTTGTSSVLIQNILNGDSDDADRAITDIYAASYVKLSDGTVLVSDTEVAYSLFDILMLLKDQNPQAYADFVNTWK